MTLRGVAEREDSFVLEEKIKRSVSLLTNTNPVGARIVRELSTRKGMAAPRVLPAPSHYSCFPPPPWRSGFSLLDHRSPQGHPASVPEAL